MGWWVGRGSGDPCGHLLRITPDFSRFVGQVYTPRDLAEILPVSRRQLCWAAHCIAGSSAHAVPRVLLMMELRSELPRLRFLSCRRCGCCWVVMARVCAAAAFSLRLPCTACLPRQNTKSQSESEDMRARMLAALKQKQQELAGGVAFNPVRLRRVLLMVVVLVAGCCTAAEAAGLAGGAASE